MTADDTSALTPGYRQPGDDIVALVDAPDPPLLIRSPDGARMLHLRYTAMPSLRTVARPYHALAGQRLNPDGTRRRLYDMLSVALQRVEDGALTELALPANIGQLAGFDWSPDSRYIALTAATGAGLEVWLIDAHAATLRKLSDTLRVSDATSSALTWSSDSRALYVRAIPADRGAPPAPPVVPPAPLIQAASGRKAQNRTYQELLITDHDEALFVHFATVQLMRMDLQGVAAPLGTPDLHTTVIPSPDDSHLLIKTLRAPHSRQVPLSMFAHRIDVRRADGALVRRIVDRDADEELPIQGVATGPRSVRWHQQKPATLLWLEALDGGDPNTKAEHRDRLMALAAPFEQDPQESLRTQHRFQGLGWLTLPDQAFVSEYDRDRRWTTTRLHSFAQLRADAGRVIFDRSAQDRYNDPGSPIYTARPDGTWAIEVVNDGEHIHLAGSGASPQGDKPFLDLMELATLQTTRVMSSPEGGYQTFEGFGPGPHGARGIIARRESQDAPPNTFFLPAGGGPEVKLTDERDPHPQLSGLERRLLTYKRADGVPLSGMLYLPPGYQPGQKLPLVVWAYPLEYNDAATAGQVRLTPTRFTRISGTSPLMFLLRGYAVLDRAAMPVVGDPKTMNDTFIPQIVGSAQAAIDAVVAEGVADPTRVAVGGHSYGAFMVANLLAHSRIFRAGIGRSGAYNRTLTPFGFQGERRTLWEAAQTYAMMSPLMHADKIEAPLLLIHGQEDNNSGTYPMQSERLFQAIQGLGGTARLVMLPHESHGYQARESILHVLTESFEWLDAHLAPLEADAADAASTPSSGADAAKAAP